MNLNGANKWWASKKTFWTSFGTFMASACGILALYDTDPKHLAIYGLVGLAATYLSGNHVASEAKIDAAAVQKAVPDTVVTNTNIEKEN